MTLSYRINNLKTSHDIPILTCRDCSENDRVVDCGGLWLSVVEVLVHSYKGWVDTPFVFVRLLESTLGLCLLKGEIQENSFLISDTFCF